MTTGTDFLLLASVTCRFTYTCVPAMRRIWEPFCVGMPAPPAGNVAAQTAFMMAFDAAVLTAMERVRKAWANEHPPHITGEVWLVEVRGISDFAKYLKVAKREPFQVAYSSTPTVMSN